MKGFTLVEVLIGTFLMLLVFLGIFGAFQLTLKVVGQSRAAVTALAVANQRIEVIRNLPYRNIGTIGGVPAGPLLARETITRNRISYTVKTTVIYIDDPFDGLAPNDDTPNDYKRAEIKVSWMGFWEGKRVLVTDIAPRGRERRGPNGGTLAISVFDARGAGVAGANIHILNTKVSPIINANYFTNPNGRFILVGAPESDRGYQITISKANYSTDRTFGEDKVSNPLKPHASVYRGGFTEISFSIDRLSSLRVESRGSKALGYPLIPNLSFGLRGKKIIGHNTEGAPVYKYSQTHTTNALAEITISGLEWDSYSFSVNKALTGFDLIGIESPPGVETRQPINLLPNTHQNIRLILGAENSLLVTVQDSLTLEPIFDARVRVYNPALRYEDIRPTNKKGQAFFAPLKEADYNLEVSALGYLTVSTSVSVKRDTIKTVRLSK